MALAVLGVQTHEGKQVVVIESDREKEFQLAIAELQGPESRRLAIGHGTRALGIPNASTGMPTAPYAVDKDGGPVVDGRTQKIWRYRIDVPVTQGVGMVGA